MAIEVPIWVLFGLLLSGWVLRFVIDRAWLAWWRRRPVRDSIVCPLCDRVMWTDAFAVPLDEFSMTPLTNEEYAEWCKYAVEPGPYSSQFVMRLKLTLDTARAARDALLDEREALIADVKAARADAADRHHLSEDGGP